MEIFLDTGDVKETQIAFETGLVDGITTNPSLIAKSKKNYIEVVHGMLQYCKGPISCEVLSEEYEPMLKEAKQWAEVSPQVIVKLPLTEAGLRVCQECTKLGIKTNVTLCFQPNQAILAAKSGATYISPFVGRLDDISQQGMNLIQDIKTIFSNYNFKTKILVASIRSNLHINQAAVIGADTLTIPYKTLTQMVKHPLTDAGLEIFRKDGMKIPSVF